jgi:hypothetical protein
MVFRWIVPVITIANPPQRPIITQRDYLFIRPIVVLALRNGNLYDFPHSPSPYIATAAPVLAPGNQGRRRYICALP